MNNFVLQFLPLVKLVLPYVRKVHSKLRLEPLTFSNGNLVQIIEFSQKIKIFKLKKFKDFQVINTVTDETEFLLKVIEKLSLHLANKGRYWVRKKIKTEQLLIMTFAYWSILNLF
jgi:hypothetical protein